MNLLSGLLVGMAEMSHYLGPLTFEMLSCIYDIPYLSKHKVIIIIIQKIGVHVTARETYGELSQELLHLGWSFIYSTSE